MNEKRPFLLKKCFHFAEREEHKRNQSSAELHKIKPISNEECF
jgi:hypothetical protein